MNFSYNFDFGPRPSFLIDAWFRKAVVPVALLSALLFPLSALSDIWFARIAIPSTAAGAITIFLGIYLYRRSISIKRVRKMENTQFHYTIDDEGIHYSNELGRGLLRWGFKGKIIPMQRVTLLQSSEIGLLPLPSDAPAEVIAFINNRLQ